MRLIAHRGNINGVFPSYENSPDYVVAALNQKYDCEIDLWRVNDNNFLGHDGPQYFIDDNFLINNDHKLWIHCKNFAALKYLKYNLSNYNLNYFWHENDDCTITSQNFVWIHPNSLEQNMCGHKMIAVLPEKCQSPVKNIKEFHGICSDFIENYK